MKTRLSEMWKSRSPRERAVAAVLAAILGAVLYMGWAQSAERARGRLRAAVTTLGAQAARLERQAAEAERLRAAPPPPASQSDLRALVQAHTGAAGLSRAVVRMDAENPDQVQVVFGAVAFADWLAWAASLQSQQVRLDACRIEALSTAGLVSATATLTRAKLQ